MRRRRTATKVYSSEDIMNRDKKVVADPENPFYNEKEAPAKIDSDANIIVLNSDQSDDETKNESDLTSEDIEALGPKDGSGR